MIKLSWHDNGDISRLIESGDYTMRRVYPAVVRQSKFDQTWLVKIWHDMQGTGCYFTETTSYADRETAKAVAMALVVMR